MPESIPPEVRAARRDVARLAGERSALLREGARLGAVDTARLGQLDLDIAGTLDGVASLVDPCDASEVDPLILLPVRLETRFGRDGQRDVLRVRIYPDQVHLDDLDRGLSDEEVAAGRGWWTAAWTDPIADTAWPSLVAAVGRERAEWVAHACTPTNLVERTVAATPTFPSVPPRGPRAIIARALPDRFVVMVVRDNGVARAVGRPVPRDLVMTPIPLDSAQPVVTAGGLTVPPGGEWLVDYDAAVAVGMAVTVPLPGAAGPIRRVVAVGTRASATPAAGADEFEDLLRGHRYWGGLGVLAQGTPTNNADAARSPYQARREPQAPALTPVAAQPGSDATAAAQLLGVDAGLLATLLGHGTGEQAVAGEVNTCLWSPGWGAYLARLDDQDVPGVTDAQREAARRLFSARVRGRGVAPTIHVGAQPYGLLPASNLRTWVPRAGETTAGVLAVVRRLLDRWLAATAGVATMRPGSADIEATLLEVLGHSPVLQGLRVRPMVSEDVAGAVTEAVGLRSSTFDAERITVTAVLSGLLGDSAHKAILGSLHPDTRALPLPLASSRDPEFIAALLGSPSRVRAVDSVLQALLALAWNSTDLDVARAAPAAVLPVLVEHLDLDPVMRTSAMALLARAETATAADMTAMVQSFVATGTTPSTAATLKAYQPIESIATSVAEVALAAPVTDESRALAKAALAGWFLAMGYRAEVREAMTALMGTDLHARRLAVAEALDCSSHRLDAWATAIVAQRRADQASRSARGLTLGAYGVVEDLTPRTGKDKDGWILAPSVAHATAAGMLRSSHLSHLPAGNSGGPFAIDLSSERLHGATRLIEGVRAGQQLGALIGYQIERELGAVGLARLQLSLRTLAPLVARRLTDADGADGELAQEAIAANNVVDGVLLLQRHSPADGVAMTGLKRLLDLPPKNAYLDPGDWQALTQAEFSQVRATLSRAADSLDAVADVMLSESVLQFAGGNAQRAAAAMDSMATGASPADTVDVLETHDSNERLTHRVMVVVAEGTSATGWTSSRPRALAEPRLEAWAGSVLGDPARIVVADTDRPITLDEAGLAALDLVHVASPDELERTLRSRIPDLRDAELAVVRDPSWDKPLRAVGQVVRLAETLRVTIAGAAPLLPAALDRADSRTSQDHAVAVAAALPELLGRVSGLVGGLANAVALVEPLVAGLPQDQIVADEATAQSAIAKAAVLEPYGVPLEPTPELPRDLSWLARAWQTARARALAGQAGLDAITAAAGISTPLQLLEAAQEVASTILGDAFVVVPVLADGAGLAAESAAPAFPQPAPTAVRAFLRDLGTVRPQVGRYSEVLLLAGAIGSPQAPAVVQLCERDGLGAPATGTTLWLAGPLPAEEPWPTGAATHVVVDAVGKVSEGSVAGLVIDSWVEDLPGRVRPGTDPADPRPGRTTLGLAVRTDSPSASPPQVILSAISPDGRRWTADALRGVIEGTLDLARVRMLHLHTLPGDGMALPALYTKSSSLQGEAHLDFRMLAQSSAVSVAIPFMKEAP